ncbi:MAG: hypothetical protein ACI9H6_000233 [Patiriisocius sp.]
MTCPENDVIKATVTGFTQTKDGDVMFASTEDYGTVTFATTLDVWKGSPSPQKGEVVILSGMTRFKKGWRAMNARRFVLSDESKNSE